jgi:hypothetical protein
MATYDALESSETNLAVDDAVVESPHASTLAAVRAKLDVEPAAVGCEGTLIPAAEPGCGVRLSAPVEDGCEGA